MANEIQKSNVPELQALLESRRSLLAEVAPKHLTPERLIKIALLSVGRNETLKKCTAASILAACIQSAEVGLEPGGVLQHAALVPFFNGKTGCYEAQFQPMFKGLLHLVRNSGDVLDVQTGAVRKGDKFRYERGLTPRLKHVPALGVERGEITHFYCVIRFKSGGAQWEVMTKAEVDSIKDKVLSRAKGRPSPWTSDYEEMGKKTVLKRTVKLCPVSAEAAKAIAQDDAIDTGEVQPVDIVAMTAEAPNFPAQDAVAPLPPADTPAKAREPGEDDGDPEQPSSDNPPTEPAKGTDEFATWLIAQLKHAQDPKALTKIAARKNDCPPGRHAEVLAAFTTKRTELTGK